MAIQRKLLDCFAALAMTLVLLVASPASAQTFPHLTGRVVDQADLLRPEQELDISSKSQALEAQTGRQFVVATVKSLEGYPIDDYAYRLGRAWKIGDEKRDDGVVLLVAPNERKVWIATGYGSGAFLTDAMSGVITREAILPQFKKNPPDYGAGIAAGADAIIKQMSLPPDQARANAEKAQQQASKRSSGGVWFLPILFAMIVGFAILASLARRGSGKRYRPRYSTGISPWVVLWGLNELNRASRGRGGWGGGSWGGGGGGFGGFGGGGGGFGGFSGGGGSFGGGGAGGSW